MTLSFTHIAWIAVLLLSSFAAGWMLRRLRSLEREAARDDALRDAEERAGGMDAERQQHLSLLKRNLDTEVAAKVALEASLKKRSNELAQARSALNDVRAEIKTLRDAAAIANPVDPSDTAAVTEAAISERLRAALAERDRKLVQLEVEIARIQAQKADTERRLDQERSQLNDAVSTIEERDGSIATLTEEVDKWRVRVPKLAESLKAREATIADNQHAIDGLTTKATKLEQESGALQQQNAGLRQELATVTQQHEAAREAHRQQAESQEKRLQAQERDLDAFAREVDTLRKERYELVRAADGQRVELTERHQEQQSLNERVEALSGELSTLQFEQRSWVNERETHAATVATLEADRGGLVLEIDMLRQRAEEATELAASRDIELKREFGTRARLEREFTELKYRAAPLEELLARRDAELAERGARIEALQAQVAKLDTTLAERHARAAELERSAAAKAESGPDPRADYLEKRLVQQIDKNHDLTRSLAERDKHITVVAREKSLHEKSLAVLTQQLKDARDENARLAARLGPEQVAAAAQRTESAAPVEDDDWQRPIDADNLQVIRGIGRSFERKLNELGITRLSQIVNLGEDDMDLIERELDTFKGRIGRDDWVGQAAALIADSGELDRPLPPASPALQPVNAAQSG